jgi:hypothetical protein
MGNSNVSPCQEKPRANGSGCSPAHCPVCNGVLIPLRGNYRCARCYFSLCAGCEPLEVPDPSEEQD